MTTGTPWPRPLEPGPETRALRRCHRDVTWTSTVSATPDRPAMEATGRAAFRWSPCGLWVLGDFRQDQFHEGRKVAEWSAQYIAGWDAARRTYIAFAADSNGRSVPFSGKIDGDRFVIISEGPAMGGAAQLRMTWDAADPDAMIWQNEISVSNGPWTLIERYVMTPA